MSLEPRVDCHLEESHKSRSKRIIEAEDADASESLRINPGSEYFYFLSKKMCAILLTSFIPFNFFDAILKEN